MATDWTDCPLISIDPEVVSGTAVLKGTRLPADTLTENVEAYMEWNASLSMEQSPRH